MNGQTADFPDCWIDFEAETGNIPLPQRFTFPFHYEPHPLCAMAALQLQHRLEQPLPWQHDFGLEKNATTGLGKMFGVLVVQHPTGKIGFLAAFSGKIDNQNQYPGFCPPVFDILVPDGFFRQNEAKISELTRQIEVLEQDPKWIGLQQDWQDAQAQSQAEIATLKQQIKQAKLERDQRRTAAATTIAEPEMAILHEQLNRESAAWYYQLRELNKSWKLRLAHLQQELEQTATAIQQLKQTRRDMSAWVQQHLFEQYTFLNINSEQKGISTIFGLDAGVQPPAGAGECAAPKLLQYAFLHQLRPLAMAEFWWGRSPDSEIRRHKYFYPACKSKCAPILGHMLSGIETDPDPQLTPPVSSALDIVYEDDWLIAVNKPAGLFSVPGKYIQDSVLQWLQKRYPEATGPLLVHRLDAATSGLLLAAKTKDAHEHLQKQFLHRSVQKRYVALLDGHLSTDQGLIDLPLRVDLDDRPRQLVCYEYGKPAQTRWEMVEQTDRYTRVHFYPLTGRTHQLRVHAAHAQGLNTPILGDDLYGRQSLRLYLHAEWLAFEHPVTGEKISLECQPDF